MTTLSLREYIRNKYVPIFRFRITPKSNLDYMQSQSGLDSYLSPPQVVNYICGHFEIVTIVIETAENTLSVYNIWYSESFFIYKFCFILF